MLAVEYKFAYTSSGGLAQRSFTIPMTEETIVELIKTLESKLTASALAKEQRTLMTSKLRDFIKIRDNYTWNGPSSWGKTAGGSITRSVLAAPMSASRVSGRF